MGSTGGAPDPISRQAAADSAELGFWRLPDLAGLVAEARRKPPAIRQAKASSVARRLREERVSIQEENTSCWSGKRAPRGSQDTQPTPEKRGPGLDIQEEPVCNGQTHKILSVHFLGRLWGPPGIWFPAEQEPSANLEVRSMH